MTHMNLKNSTPETVPGTARRRPGDPAPDMTGFLAFHRALRRDFRRLAAAVEACDAQDRRRRTMIDEHTGLLLRALHHHHTAEDEHIWPLLRALAPSACAALDRLEAEHQEMDVVIGRVAVPGRDAREQTADLRRLHELINAHLDLEEIEAVPLIVEHVRPEWWDGIGAQVAKANDRREIPMIACLTFDAASDEQRAQIFATAPAVLKVLYRLKWRRAYERRMVRIFG